MAHGHESVVGDGMCASLIVLSRRSIFEMCRTVRVIPRYARFSYESALKRYESARAQAFEQHVMDVKESSMVTRALPAPQSPPHVPGRHLRHRIVGRAATRSQQ